MWTLTQMHVSVTRADQHGCRPSRTGKESGPVKTKTHTLVERVEQLVQAENQPPEWGNPRLSSTPTSLAIRELAARTEALQDAVREIAREVQKLSDQS